MKSSARRIRLLFMTTMGVVTFLFIALQTVHTIYINAEKQRVRHVRELLTTYQENEEGSLLSASLSKNSSEIHNISSISIENHRRTFLDRTKNATRHLVITSNNVTKFFNKSGESSSQSIESESTEPGLDYYKLALITGNTARGSTPFIWEPYVSLHAVKHIFNVTLSADFTKQKLKSLGECSAQVKQKGVYHSDICTTYFNEALLQKIVLPNFYGKCHTGFASDDVTLLIQMDTSHGYFEKLYQVVKYWSGPISVALFVNASGSEEDLTQDGLRQWIQGLFTKHDIEGASVCLHLVTSQGLNYYPVNTLRNVAIQYAQTDVIFLIEADFIPMPGLNNVIKRPLMKRNLFKGKVAYVVPAFGTLLDAQKVPSNKQELIKQWHKNVTLPIHDTKTFKRGHMPTDYKKYWFARKAYKVEYQLHYEPYYVVHRKLVPYYPEEFQLGFKDKSVHAFLLNSTGFEFHVLPKTFIVHTPHKKQYARDGSTYICALTAFREFLRSTLEFLNPVPASAWRE